MRFVSVLKSPNYFMKLAEVKIIQTNTGTVQQTLPPADIRFVPIAGRFFTEILPTPEGFAQGRLETDEAAAYLRGEGHVFLDEFGKDVTEREVTSFLLGHPTYGVDFIAIDEETGYEVGADKTELIREEGGGYWCRICKKHLAGQGANIHLEKSKEHLANSAIAKQQRNITLAA